MQSLPDLQSMPARPFHILLVEDDEVDVLNVRRALTRSEEVASITVASDGVEAMRLLRSAKLPRERMMILLDINMPRMSGLDLLRELRNDPALASIPVVVLTTSDDPRDRKAAFGMQAAGYFVKPGSAAAFRAIIDSLRTYWSRAEFAPHT